MSGQVAADTKEKHRTDCISQQELWAAETDWQVSNTGTEQRVLAERTRTLE